MAETDQSTAAMTGRDRVWAAALRRFARGDRTVTTAAVRDELKAGLGAEACPSDDTIKRVLNAMTAAGICHHEPRSHEWAVATAVPASAADGPATTYLRDRNATPWTFADPAVRRWAESRLDGRVCNLFAGQTVLDHPDGDDIVRNDLDTSHPALDAALDLGHVDALRTLYDRFIRAVGYDRAQFDTVLVDPPWSYGKDRTYDGGTVDRVAELRDAVASLGHSGPDRVVWFGYDSTGVGASRGYHTVEVCTIHFTGNHNDTIAVVQERD